MNLQLDPRDVQIANLIAQNATLREELAQMRALLVSTARIPNRFRLARIETTILRCLMASAPAVVSNERMMMAIYGGRDTDWPSENCMRVCLMRLRRKVAPYGMTIPSLPLVGVYLPADSLAILHRLNADEEAVHDVAAEASTLTWVR